MQIFTFPSPEAEQRIDTIMRRGIGFSEQTYRQVEQIVNDVRDNGDDAVLSYINRFDSPRLKITELKVTPEEIAAARKQVDRGVMRSLDKAVAQIERFHKKQRVNSWIDTDRDGTVLGQLVNPVERVGLYVPGGKGGQTPLVSTVLMGAVPARIAGVDNICMATPADNDGGVNPYLLAAADKVGIDTIYKFGSAWAVAAMAHGTATVAKVDVIVGPGNQYVTLAKKIVAGTVGIDMIAGPSEVLVIADANARPDFVAADLLSQAEHDPLAAAVLITDSPALAQAVARETAIQLKTLSRQHIARESLECFGAILCVADLPAALALSNRLAPEHLELLVKDPFAYIGQIRNAGAVFLGAYTPEPVGDYLAGPNHTLPTAGTARFSSALSVDTFVKKTSVVHYSRTAFDKDATDIIRLADIEGLDAHANSVRVRGEKDGGRGQ